MKKFISELNRSFNKNDKKKSLQSEKLTILILFQTESKTKMVGQ